jgi:hypothetical protein
MNSGQRIFVGSSVASAVGVAAVIAAFDTEHLTLTFIIVVIGAVLLDLRFGQIWKGRFPSLESIYERPMVRWAFVAWGLFILVTGVAALALDVNVAKHPLRVEIGTGLLLLPFIPVIAISWRHCFRALGAQEAQPGAPADVARPAGERRG